MNPDLEKRKTLKTLGILGASTLTGALGICYSIKDFFKPKKKKIISQNSQTQNEENFYKDKIKTPLKERLFVNNIIQTFKKQKNKLKLNRQDFLYLRKLKGEYSKKSKKNQEEKDIIYIYAVIKYKHLIQITREKIKHEFSIYNSSKELILSQFNKNEKIRKIYITDTTIFFAKLHPTLPQILINNADKYDLNYEILFIIALIENNFGGWTESPSGALGPLQIKPNTIETVEEYFNITPRYNQLKTEKDKRWRLIIDGILNIKYLIEKMELKINHSNLINDIDFYILLLTYNQGMGGILEKIEEKYNNEGINYVKKAKSILSYNWDYITKK